MRAIPILLSLLLAGCAPDARNNGNTLSGRLRISSQGVRYELVTIEGRTFVATQDYHGYWHFAGPIDL